MPEPVASNPEPVAVPPPRPAPRWPAALALVGAVLAVYLPALANGFVWDDTALVLRDPLVRSPWLAGEAFRHFLFLDATGSAFYRPLQRLTFQWDYALWGFQPSGWHLTNLLLHAGATLALHGLARSWLAVSRNAEPAAFLVALAWAIHPVHSSAVIYVSGRADSLAALFGFLALRLALHPGPHPGAAHRPLPASLFLLAAALSKESGLVFLPLWILIARFGCRLSATALLRVALAPLLCYVLLRAGAQATPPPPILPAPLVTRARLALEATAEYAGLLALPLRLTMERDLRIAPGAIPRLLLGALLLLAAIAWWLRRRPDQRPARGAALCAAIAYIPVSGLIPINANCAEHWLYVPSAFLAIALASALPSPLPRRLLPAAATAFAAWLLFLGSRTHLRNADWRDPHTFLTRTIATADAPDRMRMNLAGFLFRSGNTSTGLALQKEVIERRPDWHEGRLALAGMLLAAGDASGASQQWERLDGVERLEPEVLLLRAVAQAQTAPREALTLLRTARDLRPASWSFQQRFARALAEAEGPAAASADLAEWMRGSGGDFRADSWSLLATLAAQAGHPALAEEARREAKRRDIRLRAAEPGTAAER